MALKGGGFTGMPGPLDRRKGRRAAEAAITVAGSVHCDLEVDGIPLGPRIHEECLDLLRREAPEKLASAAVLRRAFRRGRLAGVVVPYDVEPYARLVVVAAKEAGIPTLLFEHGGGGWVLRHILADIDVICDQVAIWSEESLRYIPNRDRPIHVIGYPVPHATPPTKPFPQRPDPRVVILGYGRDVLSPLLDDRYAMRHYVTAVDALLQRFPQAHVVLRPHPSDDMRPVHMLIERRSGHDFEVDTATDIIELLDGADLCIAVPSTAAFQAALVGTPVIVCNVSGFEWGWPLGEGASVPVAYTEDELVAWLERWASDPDPLPGRDDLLHALGAGGGDATGAVMRILSGANACSSTNGRGAAGTSASPSRAAHRSR